MALSNTWRPIGVGLENADALTAIDTLTNKVIATTPIGQAPQAITYVSDAVPEGAGTANLQPLGLAGAAAHLALAPARKKGGQAPTTVTLFDQGLSQVLQTAVTGLEPKQPYALALATRANGGGRLEPLAAFMTNPAGSAIVNAVGPIRQIVQNQVKPERHYLVIVPNADGKLGKPVQVQVD
jgi:YVTN family beta-propeller protein